MLLQDVPRDWVGVRGEQSPQDEALLWDYWIVSLAWFEQK